MDRKIKNLLGDLNISCFFSYLFSSISLILWKIWILHKIPSGFGSLEFGGNPNICTGWPKYIYWVTQNVVTCHNPSLFECKQKACSDGFRKALWYTVCQRSLVSVNITICYIKLDKTFRAYSIYKMYKNNNGKPGWKTPFRPCHPTY